MNKRLLVLMDPIASIKPEKDSTVAMLLAAQRRGWTCAITSAAQLHVQNGVPWADWQQIHVQNQANWVADLGFYTQTPLNEYDAILIRQDPPVDTIYWHATQILSLLDDSDTLVLNHPQALRDANEKLFTLNFPDCCPPTLVSSTPSLIQAFIEQHGRVVLKPLDGFGGQGIYCLTPEDINRNMIVAQMTQNGRQPILAQPFLPDIAKGDKRILLINGEPIPYALARCPQSGDFRGNLAAGGQGEAQPLSERDRWLCSQVSPTLKAQGLAFVGLDVIGDYITEINVTSPTCIRQLDAACNLDIGGQFLNYIEVALQSRKPSDP